MTLSVVVPGYNTSLADWRRCLRSIMPNLAKGDEVICVDNGSREPLRKIDIEDVCPQARVVVASNNQGPGAARNVGMAVAQGDLVAFVDSDDELVSQTLAKTAQLMWKHGADVGLFGVHVVWPGDGLVKTDCADDSKGLNGFLPTLPAVAVWKLYEENLLNYVWNKIYKRSFLVAHKIVFSETAITGEDLLFNLECLAANCSWYLTSEVGYTYYRTRRTLLSCYKRSLVEGFKAIEKGWDKYFRVNPSALACLGKVVFIGDYELHCMEWRNIWMRATPYSLLQRWQWLLRHREVGGVGAFMRMWLFTFFRTHFYIRPIRRWHIRRLYPQVSEWKPCDK